MIQVAICTDSLSDSISTMRRVERFRAQHKRAQFYVQHFTSKKMNKDLKQSAKFSIFILDSDALPDCGLTLAREIRDFVPDAVIIYLSSTTELAFRAYSLHAQRYLLKPLASKHFDEALTYALSYVASIQKKHLGIKTSDGMIKISYDQINHVESNSRVYLTHCKNGRIYRSVSLRKSFEYTLDDLLGDSRFVQTHKSFIVNMNMIKSMNSQDMLMQNGSILPIAQSRYSQVKDMYRNFLGLGET